MQEPTAKTVLRAVVRGARSELKLINPDIRRVCLMLTDGLEALTERAERQPDPIEVKRAEPVEVHTAEPVETRTRRKKS